MIDGVLLASHVRFGQFLIQVCLWHGMDTELCVGAARCSLSQSGGIDDDRAIDNLKDIEIFVMSILYPTHFGKAVAQFAGKNNNVGTNAAEIQKIHMRHIKIDSFNASRG